MTSSVKCLSVRWQTSGCAFDFLKESGTSFPSYFMYNLSRKKFFMLYSIKAKIQRDIFLSKHIFRQFSISVLHTFRLSAEINTSRKSISRTYAFNKSVGKNFFQPQPCHQCIFKKIVNFVQLILSLMYV